MPPEATKFEQELFCGFDEWLPKIVENEHRDIADDRLQLLVVRPISPHPAGNRGGFVVGNLMQGAPKLVFQRHASLMLH